MTTNSWTDRRWVLSPAAATPRAHTPRTPPRPGIGTDGPAGGDD